MNQAEHSNIATDDQFPWANPNSALEESSAPLGQAATWKQQVLGLEAENRRLLVLIAELLIKNQELRKASCAGA